MEEPSVKENLPIGCDDLHQTFKSAKMTTSTPRQPLSDLKQMGRPLENVPSKSTTPLGTPKPSKLQRKMKPVSLQRGLGMESSLCNMATAVSSKLPDKMDEIFEEDVEQFVTHVLNQCVQDMTTEDNKTIDLMEEKFQSEDDEEPNHELGCNNDNVEVENSDKVNKLNDEVNEENRILQRHDFVSQFGDVSVNEDNLLDESNYSNCCDAFHDSSKSDEELLASFAQTPCVKLAPSKTDTDNCSTESKMEQKHVYTPGPTFLDKVALMQRVKAASSNLANWVFPSSVAAHHLQEIPTDNTIKVVHDVACSPMPLRLRTVDENAVHESVGDSEDNNGDSNKSHDSNSSETVSSEVKEVVDTDKAGFEKCTDESTDIDVESCLCQERSSKNSFNTHDDENLEKVSEEKSEEKIPMLTNHSVSSVACSPMCHPMCDFSVQNEIGTQSATCSPIRFESLDKSTQNEVQLHSTLCSPIRFPACDISIQNAVDMQSVMCSPMSMQVNDVSIQNGADMQSVMCSPIRIPVHDVSVQSTAVSQSVMCSPMVPCPSHDKSVLTSSPDLVDNSMMTDVKSCSSVAVEVQPEMVSVSTEMDDNPMLTIGTSMTPLKLDKKQGKKLTADDVRKQHPRVLANEFETLRLQNSRLESQVHGLEKDRKKLVAYEEIQRNFSETKQCLQDLETKHEIEMLSWQQKYDLLETDLKSVTLAHENEIVKVRAEYESNDYREHFYASQKLVQELQTELNEFATLADDFESSKNLQSRMQNSVKDCFTKIKNKTEWIKTQEAEIKMKDAQLKEQLLKYSEDSKTLEEDKISVQNEREQMAQMIAKCKEGMIELDSQLKKTKAELEATEETVLGMREENDTVSKERDTLKSQYEGLTKQNVDLQSEMDKVKDELHKSQSTIKELEEKLADVNKRLTESIDKLQKEEAAYRDSSEKKKLLIRNLERTLESRESEIDSQDKELFECREEIYKQMEAAKAHEIKEKDLTRQLESTQRELSNLKDCCAKLRAKEQETRSTLSGTLEELSYTQQFASEVMRKQGTEITDASSTIDELVDKMVNVLASLCRRAGIEEKSKVVEGPEVTSTDSTKDTKAKKSSSLVSQVLSAASSAEHEETEEPENTDNGTETDSEQTAIDNDVSIKNSALELEDDKIAVESPHTLSRKKLGCTANSAFAPIHSVKPKDSGENSAVPMNSANIDSSNETMKSKDGMKVGPGKHFSNKVESRFEEVCNIGDEQVGLNNQLERVTELFTEITRVAHIIEKALRSSLNDVTFENEDFSSRVSQCEYSEKRIKAELEFTQSELEKSRKIVDELNLRIHDMSDKFESMLDQDVQNKRLMDEVSRIKEKYQALEAERDFLNEQIAELLQKMETVSDGNQRMSGVDVNAQKEILYLKKKVEKYRSMMREKDDQIEQITAKASNRIQKLESNWKTADAEVCRFDELVDIVRSELVSHRVVMEDKNLVSLIELIDGRVPLSSFKKKRNQEDLKPIKTMKW